MIYLGIHHCHHLGKFCKQKCVKDQLQQVFLELNLIQKSVETKIQIMTVATTWLNGNTV